MADDDGVALNISHLRKACLQKRAFLLLWHSVNIRSKMEQGPAIKVRLLLCRTGEIAIFLPWRLKMEKFTDSDENVVDSEKNRDSTLNIFAKSKTIHNLVALKLVDQYLSQVVIFIEESQNLLLELNAIKPMANVLASPEAKKINIDASNAKLAATTRLKNELSQLERALVKATEEEQLLPLLDATRREPFHRIFKDHKVAFDKTIRATPASIGLNKLIEVTNYLLARYNSSSEVIDNAFVNILMKSKSEISTLDEAIKRVSMEADYIQDKISNIEYRYNSEFEKFNSYYNETLDFIGNTKKELDWLFLPIPQKCKIMTLKHHSGSVGSSNEEFQNFGSAYLDAIASISITGTVSLNSNLPIKLMCCQATGEISLSLAIAA